MLHPFCGTCYLHAQLTTAGQVHAAMWTAGQESDALGEIRGLCHLDTLQCSGSQRVVIRGRAPYIT